MSNPFDFMCVRVSSDGDNEKPIELTHELFEHILTSSSYLPYTLRSLIRENELNEEVV